MAFSAISSTCNAQPAVEIERAIVCVFIFDEKQGSVCYLFRQPEAAQRDAIDEIGTCGVVDT